MEYEQTVEEYGIEMIQEVEDEVGYQFELTECSSGYLIELVQPYLTAMDGITDHELLIDWIKRFLPNDIEDLHPQFEGVEVNDIKQIVESHLMMKIACATQTHFSKGHFYTHKLMCTPWDILNDGAKDPEVGELFFAELDTTLPVTITINGISHVHMITEEVVIGLLLYCDISKYDISLSMCGIPFTEAFIEVLLNRAFYDNKNSQYVMTLTDDRKVQFSEPEFLQWFMTGALWNKRDVASKYWKEIFSRSLNSSVFC
jgi:hypothetical protein